MQQFAINATFDQDVFSVNGPPGTGKTSLLRELIAQNIVARAKILSRFTMAKDAFVGRQALNFENSDPIFVSELHTSAPLGAAGGRYSAHFPGKTSCSRIFCAWSGQNDLKRSRVGITETKSAECRCH